jgi:outer membrane immunogenic protein
MTRPSLLYFGSTTLTQGAIMKKLLFAGVAGVGFVVGAPANAADLGARPQSYKAPPMVAPVPVFTWSGCYIGGHVGGGWGRKTVSAPALAPGISVSGDTSGFLGGGQLGCDYQFAPNWVIGIEGDGSAADIKGDIGATVFGVTGTGHARSDWIASAAGRLGWAWDRWLLYAKGGGAWVGDKYSADIPQFLEHLEASETRSGWTVGGGLEWAFWNNWSAKLEYDYYDFGTRTLTFTGTIAGIPEAVPAIDISQKVSTVKFGLNYRFNWKRARSRSREILRREPNAWGLSV